VAGFVTFVGTQALEPAHIEESTTLPVDKALPALPEFRDLGLRKPDVGLETVDRDEQPAELDEDAGGSRR
jgi:hypothetical protein